MTASTRQVIMARSRLKPSGRIGDNMKKILGLIALIALIVLSCFYFFIHQPKNIFDEIYQETEKTYRTNNILRKIDGFEISPGWPSDGEYSKYYPFGTYNKNNTPEDYFEIEIGFNFATKTQLSSISFEKRIGPNVRVRIWDNYSRKDRLF